MRVRSALPTSSPVSAPRYGTIRKCAIAVGASGTHTCAVMGDQSVTCGGNNNNGECGPAAHGGPTPTTVTGIGPARLVRASDTATCALLVDKSVWC